MALHQLKFKPSLLVAIATLALGAAACSNAGTGDQATDTATDTEGTEMAADGSSQGFDLTLSGAGASFPAPLYQTWFSEIQQEYPGLQINYQSVGSGAGIEQYLSGTVDFGATDAPLNAEERQTFMDEYGTEPIQVPMTGGLVTFAYNLPGVENLKLTQDAYCGIVTGEVTQWDAQPIASANPNADLPSQSINFVHRSDGSGTTFLFTNHINEVCNNWEGGAAKTIDWPVGVGAKGNEGIAAQVQQTEGAVGYVEYTYAAENEIATATLENAAGNFIEPSPEAAATAFEGVEVPEDFALLVPNPSGEDAYPIVGLTWMLLYPEYDDPQVAKAIETMVDWAQNDGGKFAKELGYIPLAGDVSERVKSTVAEKVSAQ